MSLHTANATVLHTAHHTVSISQVLQILQGVRQRGDNIHAIVQRAGIAPALLDSPLARVTQAQYAALTFVLRRVTRDELWGLCHHPLRVGSFVQACRLLVHCQTLGEVLRTGCRFFHLQLHDFVPRLVVEQGFVHYRLVSQGPRDRAQSYAERVFAFFTYGLVSWLVARRIPLLDVTYPEADIAYNTDAELLFHAPMHYAKAHVGFRFEARWLDLPVVQNSQSLAEFLQQAPASLLARYRDTSSLADRIRRLLRKRLRDELPSLEAVGHALAITPQTLRRRLRDEGSGFQQIKDELRRDAAIEYLAQTRLPLLEIANRVGFSEASTFHRAFKSWTGVAPGEYRSALGHGEA